MTHSEAARTLKNQGSHTPAEIEAAGLHAARVLESMPDERPMTFEEIEEWTRTPYARTIYIEFRGGAVQGVNGMDAADKDAGIFEYLLTGGICGETWRCWKFYPTAEQRAAIAWGDTTA